VYGSLCGLETRPNLFCDTFFCTLSQECFYDVLPDFLCETKTFYRICCAAKFSTALFAFSFLSSYDPRSSKRTEGTWEFCHIWWQTYSFLPKKSLLALTLHEKQPPGGGRFYLLPLKKNRRGDILGI
jgi:hypothetical protein